MSEQVSYGRQITLLAEKHPDRVAIIHAATDGTEREVTWRELEARCNQTARLLEQRGIGQGSVVVVALTNSPEHFYSVIGAWKLGATVLPMRWDLPAWERDRLLDLAKANVVVANWDIKPGEALPAAPMMTLAEVRAGTNLDSSALPDRIPNPANGITSSGSTGSPKLIMAPLPGVVNPAVMGAINQFMGMPREITQLVISPLYHTNGFMCHHGLQDGHKLVLLERFDAARIIDLIERHRVEYAIMVPIMLQRVARVPNVEKRDFSSIRAILYGAAPLPGWVARAWFGFIGPEKFYIAYGGTERIGQTMATGVEWLAHEGTAGKPVASLLKVLDAEGREVPVGEIGEIFMKNMVLAKPFDYVGAKPKITEDGYSTFGDMGYVDKDGYLYIVDRRVDMVISGGANIFPAEVETALSEHPKVADVVVIGLPDEEWGRRVHAIVEASPGAELTEAELREHCKARLASYKVPKSFEFISKMPRSAAGKLSRGALTAERSR